MTTYPSESGGQSGVMEAREPIGSPRIKYPYRLIWRLIARYHAWLTERRWRALRSMGMHLGVNVNLPRSVWIDTSHCHLISIADHCGFGDGCCILAHDALGNELLDATRVGRVLIHESSHFGARTVILPGVEIGPRAIVGANSVVSRSIPPNCVAAGNPARVISTLADYLDKHRQRLQHAPQFPYQEADIRTMSDFAKARMRTLLAQSDGYIIGGYTARLAGDKS